MALSQFMEEDRVSTAMAILAVLFVILAVIFALSAAAYAVSGGIGGAFASMGMVALFGILGAIFRLIVLYQWSKAINTNVKNSQQFLSNIKEHAEDPLRGEVGFILGRLEELMVPVWPFWVYIVLYLVALFVGWFAFLLNLIGFIFLAVYLSHIFKTTNRLSDIKDKFYNYLRGRGKITAQIEIYRIPRRNIVLFIVLSVITFAIYWLYLLVKLSFEINHYLDSDAQARKQLEEVLAVSGSNG